MAFFVTHHFAIIERGKQGQNSGNFGYHFSSKLSCIDKDWKTDLESLT